MARVERIPCTYTVYYDGSIYYALSNVCGGTNYSNAVKATCVQSVIDNLEAGSGGSIYLRDMQIPAGITYGSTVIIIEDYGGSITYYRNNAELFEVGLISGDVSSFGEYGDATTLTGAVKLEEGTNVSLSRSDSHNSIVINALGGTGATYKPNTHYVAYPLGGTYYVYDNWAEAFELSAGSFSQLVSTFNSVIAANAGETFHFRDGSYTGSSSTPFTIAANRGCRITGDHMYGTRVENTNSGTAVFKIQDADWSYDGANQVFFENFTVRGNSAGIGIDAYMSTNNENMRLCLNNMHILYPKIGIRYYNPWDTAVWNNVWVRTANVADARGVVIGTNHTSVHFGNTYIYGLKIHEHGAGASGFIGLELTANISGNTQATNLLNFVDLEVQAYTATSTDSIGIYMDGSGGGNRAIQFVTFIGTSIEGLDRAIYAKGYVHDISFLGSGWVYPYQGKKPNNDGWYASGLVQNVLFDGMAFYGGANIDESAKTEDSAYYNTFRNCTISAESTITTSRSLRFDNCHPRTKFTNLDCFVNGVMPESSGGPTTSYYQVGDMCHRYSDNTFWIKDTRGVMRQII